MKLATTIAVMLALAGCGSKKSEPESSGQRESCVAAIERSIDVTIEKRRSGSGSDSTKAKAMDAVAPKLKTVLSELCTTDQWSEEVVTCFKTASDVSKCKAGLKPEQQKKYKQEMMRVMMSERGAFGTPQSRDLAGSGSAGSAGAGSAEVHFGFGSGK